jgi:tRNA 2-thiouridine synthesizing protein A
MDNGGAEPWMLDWRRRRCRMSDRPADSQLDATGLVCPEPLMLVRNRVRQMASGQVLHVLATDPSTGRDFRNFCRFMGHELLAEEQSGERFEYWIRKG